MALKTVEINIYELDWLNEKKSQNNVRDDDLDIHTESEERGSQILDEILGVFPNLKLLKSIPQMRVDEKRTGSFEYRVGYDFYRDGDSFIVIEKKNTIPNSNMSDNITDLCITISDPRKDVCNSYKKDITGVSDSYKVKGVLNGTHRLKSNFL